MAGEGGMSEIGKGDWGKNFQLQNKWASHKDEMYSMGHRLNNTGVSLYGGRW